MTIGLGALKVASGACTAAMCAVSAVLVMQDPRPGAAPLRPPLDAGPQGQPARLVIPPSCAKVNLGGAGAQSGSFQLSPAAQQALGQLQQAGGDRARQRQILSALPAKDRLAVMASLRQNRASAGAAGPCTIAGGGSPPSTPGSITATVGSGTPITPVTNSYVS